VDPKILRLRVIWTEPVPQEWQGEPTEFGMQQGRDVLIDGSSQPEGTTCYETDVTAYIDAKGWLRYRGDCVQGKSEEPFVYLSWRVRGKPAWVMRAKVMLTSLTEAFVLSLPDEATLETRVSRMGQRPPVQEWVQV
jgi:hypothetical protein